jgi:hypothetical protein
MRFHARLLALIAAAVVSTGAVAADRALVIGNNHFDSRVANNLHGAIPDADHMGSLLVDVFGFLPENVKVIHDATRADILNNFRTWLIEGTKAGDRVVFYYSGHGSTATVSDAEGTHTTSTILPSDTAPDVAANYDGPGGQILGAQLGKLIDQLDGRKVMIMADSCHSGSISRDAGDMTPIDARIKTNTPYGPVGVPLADLPGTPIRAAKTQLQLLDVNVRGGEIRPNVAVWSAVTIDQVSYDDGDSGGIFTNAFLAGLRDKKADLTGTGKITARELLDYVRKRVGDWCRSDPSCLHWNKGQFTPGLQATDDYFATILSPYQPPTTPGPGSTTPPPAPPPPSTGPELVDLAEGVLSHANDFGLTAEILPGTNIKLGATVRFRISSGEDGQLIVLDTGPDGKFRRIYPNEYSEAQGRKGSIRANAPLTIPDQSYPFEFTADQAGPGTLLVVAAEKGIDLGPILSGDAFEPATNPAKALTVLAANLSQPIIVADPNVPNRAPLWAFVSVPYVVQP